MRPGGNGHGAPVGLNYRKHRRLGPLPIWRNVSRSESGKTVSYSVKLGPFSSSAYRAPMSNPKPEPPSPGTPNW